MPAPLMLDDFMSGPYHVTLTPPVPSDAHYAPLAPHRWRETYFQNGNGGDWAQPSSLTIQKGILIVSSGFGASSGVQAIYGTTPHGVPAPLGLNLGAYSALRLGFAGLSSTEGLIVIITVFDKAGGNWALEKVIPSNGNPFVLDFPFSLFANGAVGLPRSVVHDIAQIDVEAQPAGWGQVFGITSFQAV